MQSIYSFYTNINTNIIFLFIFQYQGIATTTNLHSPESHLKKRKNNNEETPRDALKVTSTIDEALVRSPSKYEQEKKYSLVDDTQTLWTCYKATMEKYDCVHCLCSDCFTKTNVNKKSLQKRGQRSKRKSKDDDPDKCMHNALYRTLRYRTTYRSEERRVEQQQIFIHQKAI